MANVNLPQVHNALSQKLSGKELSIAQEVVSKIVKKNGTLRASKPKGESGVDSLAKYVWRMVAFVCLPGQNACMPVTADFDLYSYIESEKPHLKGVETIRYARIKDNDEKVLAQTIEDAVCHAIPKSEWRNIRAWGRALGY